MSKMISKASIMLFGLYFIILFMKVPLEPLADGSPPISSFVTNPATEIAKLVQANFWYTCYSMLPYLLISEILLVVALLKFKEKEGREPAKFHDNIKLEVFWTVVPLISVIFITLPTFDLLNFINTPPRSDLEIQVVGQRFSFRYTYLDQDITIVSTNEPLTVPAGKNVTLSMSSVDVIHAWWVPAFGVKYDLVPGRTTQIWFNAREGFYKGQCAELCGPQHADMMITVNVLPDGEFDDWLKNKVDEKNASVMTDNNANVVSL